MKTIIKQIKTLNEIYNTTKTAFDTLKRMFKNHSCIRQKVVLAEEMTAQIYMVILEKFEKLETKREFNKIIKSIKKKKK